MARARRQLEDQLRRTDLILEVCDARLPFSSRNPELIRLIGGRQHLLIMNKTDLADERGTEAWLNAFRADGLRVTGVNGRSVTSL